MTIVSEPTLLYEGMPDLQPMLGRSPGVHVSDVIHELCVKLGHFTDNEDDPNLTWMQLGSALEHAIAHRYKLEYPGKYEQVGELEKDGLFGTPDLVDVEEWVLNEIKLAWMSSNQAPDGPKFWRYWVQVKAYCYMLETGIGRLHVCHINGDYRGSGPIYRVWQGTFTQQELADNWRMLTTHAATMRARGE